MKAETPADGASVDVGDVRALHEALLGWYSRNRRDLPWRRSSDPYRIWVSEIMLQQTTVKAVLPYYEAFIKRFPSLPALAEEPEAEVLAAWSGLGLHPRAPDLHPRPRAAARTPSPGPVGFRSS